MSTNSNKNSDNSSLKMFLTFSSLLFLTIAVIVMLGASLPLMALLFLALESVGFLYIKNKNDSK